MCAKNAICMREFMPRKTLRRVRFGALKTIFRYGERKKVSHFFFFFSRLRRKRHTHHLFYFFPGDNGCEAQNMCCAFRRLLRKTAIPIEILRQRNSATTISGPGRYYPRWRWSSKMSDDSIFTPAGQCLDRRPRQRKNRDTIEKSPLFRNA